MQYMHKTKYDVLHHPRTYSNVYIVIGSTCMYKGHLNRTAFVKARVAQSVEDQATNHKIVGSSPTVDKKKIILYFVAFDTLLAGRLVSYK